MNHKQLKYMIMFLVGGFLFMALVYVGGSIYGSFESSKVYRITDMTSGKEFIGDNVIFDGKKLLFIDLDSGNMISVVGTYELEELIDYKKDE